MRAFVFVGILIAVIALTGILTGSFSEGPEGIGVLIAAWLTLFIYSFLYGDNPVYKFAEHLYVGIAAGYGAAVVFWEMWLPNWFEPLFTPAEGASPDYWLVIPGLLGILFFCRFVPNAGFMIRWPLAFLVGGYAGSKLTGYAQSDLVIQAGKTMFDLGQYANTWALLGALLIAVGVLTTLIYFFFSTPHTGRHRSLSARRSASGS
jgi:hypothetical protein